MKLRKRDSAGVDWLARPQHLCPPPKSEPNTEKQTPAKSKRKRTDEATAVHEFKSCFGKVKTQLKNIRFHNLMLDTYERDGWKSANLEKMLPVEELDRARVKIREAQIKLRMILYDLMEGEEAKKEKRLGEADEDGHDASDIYCATCGDNEDDDEKNDIVLCDLEGCNRAFHQKCCVPEVETSELGEEDEDWFCRRCSCLLDCLNLINDHLGTDFDSWQEVFPLDDDKPSAEDAKNGLKLRSRRGRKIKLVDESKIRRAAWDTHSFASDTADESFDSEQEVDNDGDSQSNSEEEESEEEGNTSESGARNSLILKYKRPRSIIDYRVLAQQMFKEDENNEERKKKWEDDAEFEDGKGDQIIAGASLKELY